MSNKMDEKEKIIENLEGIISGEVKSDKYNTFQHKMELVEELNSLYKEKLNELQEKIKEYEMEKKNFQLKKEDYDKMTIEFEEKTVLLEERRKEFEEKTVLLEERRKEFEEKIYLMDEKKKELEERNNKLENARFQIKELSKELEKKKNELEQQLKKLFYREKELERMNLELKQEKAEFENIKNKYFAPVKKQLEKGKEIDAKEIIIPTLPLNELNLQLDQDKSTSQKGRAELLQDILQELSNRGNFQGCFLMDEKGMMISELSKIDMDRLAVGAMFSLICTTILRTVKSLNLHDLDYLKMRSLNGEFLLKNIELENYERNLILLCYYDNENDTISTISSDYQQIKEFEDNKNFPSKIKKRLIKKVLKKHLKDIFYLYQNQNIDENFFNFLIERINSIRKEFSNSLNLDINQIRIKALNNAYIIIKQIFEK